MYYQSKYPHLFSSYQLGNRVVKNRIISAPTGCMACQVDGFYRQEQTGWWEIRAEGGAGIVTHGESYVDDLGLPRNPLLNLGNPGNMQYLAQLANAIKSHGAIPNIELTHGGYFGGLPSIGNDYSKSKEGKIPYGPSHDFRGENEIFAMPEEIIYQTIENFGKAAKFVKAAGFEMIMVHGGHGWLFSQWLSPYINHRTDRWGGSFENRARLLLESLDSIRRYVGPGFPIEVRMNGSECMDMIGLPGMVEEDAIQLARLIKNKCDLINVSAAVHEDLILYTKMIPGSFQEHGCNAHYAEMIKKEVGNAVAVSACGAIHDPEMMEELIGSGKVDFIETARSLIADPYLPKKAAQGVDPRAIRPCIRCMNCVAGPIINGLHECSVNPLIMHEWSGKIRNAQPTTPKKVLIAGGGPAGMQAAITLSERGHEVILCEKSGELGGALKFAKHCSFKQDLSKLKEHLVYAVGESKAEVRFNTEVTPELVESIRPDVLFLAVGAKKIIPAFPGVNGANVLLGEDVYGEEDKLGQSIVIMGGGLVGCETALHLRNLGKDVLIVEMRDALAPDANDMHKAGLFHEFADKGVKTVTNMKGTEITAKGLKCVDAEGKEVFYPADNVIIAIGYYSDFSVTETMRQIAPQVNVIADCNHPGKVKETIADAYWLSLDV